MNNNELPSPPLWERIVGVIWILILGILHLAIIFSPYIAFMLIGLWWVITLVMGEIFTRQDKRDEEAYRAAHVTHYTVADERFGTLLFEFDDEKRSLTFPRTFPPFGNAAPETVSIGNIGDRSMKEGMDLVLEAMRAAYDHQEEILAELHRFVKTSFELKKVDLPLAFIQSDFVVTSLTVCTDRPESDLAVVIEGHANENEQYKVTKFPAFIELIRSPDGSTWKLCDTSRPEA